MTELTLSSKSVPTISIQLQNGTSYDQSAVFNTYRKKRRKIRTGARNQPVAQKPNTVWAWDFVFDSCAGGRQLKCFNVVDESTRECLAIDVDHSIRSGRVLEILAALMKKIRTPSLHQI